MTRVPYRDGKMADEDPYIVIAEYDRQVSAAENHILAEGHDISGLGILRGYDRAMHPWINWVRTVAKATWRWST